MLPEIWPIIDGEVENQLANSSTVSKMEISELGKLNNFTFSDGIMIVKPTIIGNDDKVRR